MKTVKIDGKELACGLWDALWLYIECFSNAENDKWILRVTGKDTNDNEVFICNIDYSGTEIDGDVFTDETCIVESYFYDKGWYSDDMTINWIMTGETDGLAAHFYDE